MEGVGAPFSSNMTPSGSYILIIVSQPVSEDDKQTILKRLQKGLSSWDFETTGCDLNGLEPVCSGIGNKHLQDNDVLLQHSTESLGVEVLVNPTVSTAKQCIKNLLSTSTAHKLLIHAGYAFTGSGSWILQNGTFALTELADMLQQADARGRVDVHCAEEGPWSGLRRLATLNPEIRDSSLPGSEHLIECLGRVLDTRTPEEAMEASALVGNIRFNRPTLYVFPAGQGDCALFGVSGFNMLVDGGFGRRPCAWDFVRHLDRLDAVLVTRLAEDNLCGLATLVKRKALNSTYPQIGHVFCNTNTSGEAEEENDLLLSVKKEAQRFVRTLEELKLRPNSCWRDSETSALYHKVGHGTLEMHILSPPREDKHASVCALVAWRPADNSDTVTRILFPGGVPQAKIFEGLEKLKALELLRKPIVTGASLKGVEKKVPAKTNITKNGDIVKKLPNKLSSKENTPRNTPKEITPRSITKEITTKTTNKETTPKASNKETTTKTVLKENAKEVKKEPKKIISKESKAEKITPKETKTEKRVSPTVKKAEPKKTTPVSKPLVKKEISNKVASKTETKKLTKAAEPKATKDVANKTTAKPKLKVAKQTEKPLPKTASKPGSKMTKAVAASSIVASAVAVTVAAVEINEKKKEVIEDEIKEGISLPVSPTPSESVSLTPSDTLSSAPLETVSPTPASEEKEVNEIKDIDELQPDVMSTSFVGGNELEVNEEIPAHETAAEIDRQLSAATMEGSFCAGMMPSDFENQEILESKDHDDLFAPHELQKEQADIINEELKIERQEIMTDSEQIKLAIDELKNSEIKIEMYRDELKISQELKEDHEEIKVDHDDFKIMQKEEPMVNELENKILALNESKEELKPNQENFKLDQQESDNEETNVIHEELKISNEKLEIEPENKTFEREKLDVDKELIHDHEKLDVDKELIQDHDIAKELIYDHEKLDINKELFHEHEKLNIDKELIDDHEVLDVDKELIHDHEALDVDKELKFKDEIIVDKDQMNYDALNINDGIVKTHIEELEKVPLSNEYDLIKQEELTNESIIARESQQLNFSQADLITEPIETKDNETKAEILNLETRNEELIDDAFDKDIINSHEITKKVNLQDEHEEYVLKHKKFENEYTEIKDVYNENINQTTFKESSILTMGKDSLLHERTISPSDFEPSHITEDMQETSVDEPEEIKDEEPLNKESFAPQNNYEEMYLSEKKQDFEEKDRDSAEEQTDDEEMIIHSDERQYTEEEMRDPIGQHVITHPPSGMTQEPLYEEDSDSERTHSPVMEQPVFGSVVQADYPELVTVSGGTTPSEPHSPGGNFDSKKFDAGMMEALSEHDGSESSAVSPLTGEKAFELPEIMTQDDLERSNITKSPRFPDNEEAHCDEEVIGQSENSYKNLRVDELDIQRQDNIQRDKASDDDTDEDSDAPCGNRTDSDRDEESDDDGKLHHQKRGFDEKSDVLAEYGSDSRPDEHTSDVDEHYLNKDYERHDYDDQGEEKYDDDTDDKYDDNIDEKPYGENVYNMEFNRFAVNNQNYEQDYYRQSPRNITSTESAMHSQDMKSDYAQDHVENEMINVHKGESSIDNQLVQGNEEANAEIFEAVPHPEIAIDQSKLNIISDTLDEQKFELQGNFGIQEEKKLELGVERENVYYDQLHQEKINFYDDVSPQHTENLSALENKVLSEVVDAKQEVVTSEYEEKVNTSNAFLEKSIHHDIDEMLIDSSSAKNDLNFEIDQKQILTTTSDFESTNTFHENVIESQFSMHQISENKLPTNESTLDYSSENNANLETLSFPTTQGFEIPSGYEDVSENVQYTEESQRFETVAKNELETNYFSQASSQIRSNGFENAEIPELPQIPKNIDELTVAGDASFNQINGKEHWSQSTSEYKVESTFDSTVNYEYNTNNLQKLEQDSNYIINSRFHSDSPEDNAMRTDSSPDVPYSGMQQELKNSTQFGNLTNEEFTNNMNLASTDIITKKHNVNNEDPYGESSEEDSSSIPGNVSPYAYTNKAYSREDDDADGNHIYSESTVIRQVEFDGNNPQVLDTHHLSSMMEQDSNYDFHLEKWGKPMGLPTPPDAAQKTKKTTTKTLTKTLDSKTSLDNGKSYSPTVSSKMSSPVKKAKPKSTKESSISPIYVDLAYVPHHGDPQFCDVEFFKKIRARYYVFSGINPSKEVLNALLEAKKSWKENLDVTIIPTYETDTLGYWMAQNRDALEEFSIEVAPSASRCTVNLQDHETSCAAYRLEF